MTAVLAAIVLAASPLDGAASAYQAGELAGARAELEALLYPLRLVGDGLERDAHLMLAATYHAQEELGRAEEEAVRALGVQGTVAPDPLLYPPDFIAFVSMVQQRHQARIAALVAERASRRVSSAPSLTSPASPRPSALWYVVPFGAGQFQNGQGLKGGLLGGAQGVSLALAGASLGTALSLRGADGRYSAQDAGLARSLNVTYLVGAYAFLGLYAYGVVDGLLNR